MPVTSTHPDYDLQAEDWTVARDTVAGGRVVRKKIVDYLPVPPGMAQGANEFLEGGKRVANSRYGFYASFAEFPEIVGPTVEAIQGLLHEKDPEVVLPSQLEYLRETATASGDSLVTLWKRMTRELLVTGRFVMLGEVFPGPPDRLALCPYVAENFINWRAQSQLIGAALEMAVLKECFTLPKEGDDFMLVEATYYRELRVDEEGYKVRVWASKEGKQPEVLKLEGAASDADGWIRPSLAGKTFASVPLTVVNASGIGLDYGTMPVIPMSRRALSIFRLTADYRRAIYIKCDPQPVVVGVDKDDAPAYIGGGEIWVLEPAEAEAYYLDIDGQGIPLMREGIRDEYERFVQEAGRLLEHSDKITNESGEAVRRRLQAQQVTAKSLVIEAGNGMQTALQSLGRMAGLSQDEVEKIAFRPNLEFSESLLTGQELTEMITAKNLGAPLSLESMHDTMKRRGMTKKSFEEEVAAIESEGPLVTPPTPEEEPAAEPEPEPAPAAA